MISHFKCIYSYFILIGRSTLSVTCSGYRFSCCSSYRFYPLCSTWRSWHISCTSYNSLILAFAIQKMFLKCKQWIYLLAFIVHKGLDSLHKWTNHLRAQTMGSNLLEILLHRKSNKLSESKIAFTNKNPPHIYLILKIKNTVNINNENNESLND